MFINDEKHWNKIQTKDRQCTKIKPLGNASKWKLEKKL